jgi:hypothetical protein
LLAYIIALQYIVWMTYTSNVVVDGVFMTNFIHILLPFVPSCGWPSFLAKCFSSNMVMKGITWVRLVGLICFLLILVYGFIEATTTSSVEGLENTSGYQPYSGSDPLILAQQNAGNIEYLKSRIDEAMNLKKNPDFAAVSSAVDTLTQQVAVLYQQQQSIASSAQVTGLTGLGSSDESV